MKIEYDLGWKVKVHLSEEELENIIYLPGIQMAEINELPFQGLLYSSLESHMKYPSIGVICDGDLQIRIPSYFTPNDLKTYIGRSIRCLDPKFSEQFPEHGLTLILEN